MKTLFITILFLAFSGSLIAQKNYSLSFGADIAIPAEYFRPIAGNGFGPSLRFEYPISEHFGGIATIGYTFFEKKTVSSPANGTKITNKFSTLPFQLGMKYYPMSHSQKPSGVYVSGEVGIIHMTVEATLNNSRVDVDPETDFSFAPGLGYKVSKFDLSYRQQYVVADKHNHNFYGNFRIAYLF